MKIVLFINGLSSGGAEHQLCELANGLAEQGQDVTITTFSDIEDHYHYSPLVKRNHIGKGKSNKRKLFQIWRYFLGLKTDWVISFGQRMNVLCLLPLLFRSRKKIHVIAGERNTTVGKPSRQEKWLLNLLYRRVDYIVPNSNAQRLHILSLKPNYADKLVVITNYTDTSVYEATPLPNGETIRIGVLGRYDHQKNRLRFVEAIKKVKSVANKDFVVEWYGNQKFKDTSDNPLYLEMKQKVEEEGLEKVIHLCNHTKDVPTVMKRFDAFCLPSLWEGFSNALSEALCCGKPCIVSDVGDNAVMVEDGVNGYVFDPKDVNAIADAILRFLFLTADQRQTMGDESRKKAMELFNLNKFINSYITLIDRNASDYEFKRK